MHKQRQSKKGGELCVTITQQSEEMFNGMEYNFVALTDRGKILNEREACISRLDKYDPANLESFCPFRSF